MEFGMGLGYLLTSESELRYVVERVQRFGGVAPLGLWVQIAIVTGLYPRLLSVAALRLKAGDVRVQT